MPFNVRPGALSCNPLRPARTLTRTFWNHPDHARDPGTRPHPPRKFVAEHCRFLRERAAELFRLSDWVLGSTCSLHQAQSGFRNGVLQLPECDEDSMKNLYVGIASCLNSMDTLTANIKRFASERLPFVDRPEENAEDVRLYWTVLGAEGAWLERLASLNLWYCQSKRRLLVDRSYQGRPKIIRHVSAVVLYCLRLRKWTLSRWITSSTVCKQWLCARSAGFDGLVECVRETERRQHYTGGASAVHSHASISQPRLPSAGSQRRLS